MKDRIKAFLKWFLQSPPKPPVMVFDERTVTYLAKPGSILKLTGRTINEEYALLRWSELEEINKGQITNNDGDVDDGV